MPRQRSLPGQESQVNSLLLLVASAQIAYQEILIEALWLWLFVNQDAEISQNPAEENALSNGLSELRERPLEFTDPTGLAGSLALAETEASVAFESNKGIVGTITAVGTFVFTWATGESFTNWMSNISNHIQDSINSMLHPQPNLSSKRPSGKRPYRGPWPNPGPSNKKPIDLGNVNGDDGPSGPKFPMNPKNKKVAAIILATMSAKTAAQLYYDENTDDLGQPNLIGTKPVNESDKSTSLVQPELRNAPSIKANLQTSIPYEEYGVPANTIPLPNSTQNRHNN